MSFSFAVQAVATIVPATSSLMWVFTVFFPLVTFYLHWRARPFDNNLKIEELKRSGLIASML